MPALPLAPPLRIGTAIFRHFDIVRGPRCGRSAVTNGDHRAPSLALCGLQVVYGNNKCGGKFYNIGRNDPPRVSWQESSHGNNRARQRPAKVQMRKEGYRA